MISRRRRVCLLGSKRGWMIRLMRRGRRWLERRIEELRWPRKAGLELPLFPEG